MKKDKKTKKKAETVIQCKVTKLEYTQPARIYNIYQPLTIEILSTCNLLCREFAAVCQKIATFCPS